MGDLCISSAARAAINRGSREAWEPSKPRMVADPVAVLWDIENCCVPSDVNAEDVAGNIRMALRLHPAVKGFVTIFSAYGDFNRFPRRLREGCQRTGVNLIDVPNKRKDASDKAILVDMFLFALDNPPPCTIFLISGDVDFSPALHKLGQRGYMVVLAVPAGVGVSSALCNAARFVWDWPSVARGEGLVAAKSFSPEPAAILLSSDDSDIAYEDEHYSYWAHSQGVAMTYNQEVPMHSDPSFKPQKLAASQHQLPGSTALDSLNVSSCQPSSQKEAFNSSLVQLKLQFVKLLESNGGKLMLLRIPSEYSKLFGKTLYVAEYGCSKLINLIEKMSDTLSIKGECNRREVYLKECLKKVIHVSGRQKTRGEGDACNVGSNLKSCMTDAFLQGTKNGKLIPRDAKGSYGRIPRQQESQASNQCDISENANIEEQGGQTVEEYANAQEYGAAVRLEVFRQELQELLVSHACKIPFTKLLSFYGQRYSCELDVKSFGIQELETLIEKVKDVAVLQEEEGTGRRFLLANHQFPCC